MALRTKFSKRSLLGVLMLLSLVAALGGPKAGQVLRKPATAVLSPLGYGGWYLTAGAKEKLHALTADEISQDEARRLKQQNTALQAQVGALSAKVAEHLEQLRRVQQLRSLSFGPDADLPCELIEAVVTGGDSEAYAQTRLLAVKGAQAGSAVTTRELLTDRAKAIQPDRLSAIALAPKLEKVGASVLVGRLLECTGYAARLQLVTDRGFQARAKIQRRIAANHPDATRRTLTNENIALVPVQVCGDGKDGLVSVDSVKESDHVLVGDWLVTRSDDLLPAQIAIAEVTEVKPDPKQGGFFRLAFRPLADLDALREVYVVVPRGKLEKSKN